MDSFDAFIRDLVISMCLGCLNSNLNLDTNLFKKRSSILLIYLNKNRELEMQTLKAVEEFDNQLNQDNKKSG